MSSTEDMEEDLFPAGWTFFMKMKTAALTPGSSEY